MYCFNFLKSDLIDLDSRLSNGRFKHVLSLLSRNVELVYSEGGIDSSELYLCMSIIASEFLETLNFSAYVIVKYVNVKGYDTLFCLLSDLSTNHPFSTRACKNMGTTVFTPSLEGIKVVRSEEGHLLAKPFLQMCKNVLPVVGAVWAFCF